MYIVLELMQGGELLDQIVDAHAFSEREAAEIMYTVVKTVNFLHQEGVSELFLSYFCRFAVGIIFGMLNF